MNKDFAPLAVEGIDPWDGIEIEPNVRRLAEHAAQLAGLSVDVWLERAVRRACAAALPPAAPIASQGIGAGMAELPDIGEATLAAVPVGRWAMNITPETEPPAAAEHTPAAVAAHEPALPPVIADEPWDPAPVKAMAATPAAVEPPATAKPSWTIIERLAQQQTTRRAPVRLVRRDLAAAPDPSAAAPPKATTPPAAAAPIDDPFMPATPLAAVGRGMASFEDHLADDEGLPGMAERPRRMRIPDRPEASLHVAPAGWRQWLLMGVSCLLALTAGMFLAPLILRTSAPVETSRQVTVDLTPPALPSQPVVEKPVTLKAEIPPPPVQATPPAATISSTTGPATPPPATTVSVAPETPPSPAPAVPVPPPAITQPSHPTETAKPATPTAIPAPSPPRAANSGGPGATGPAATTAAPSGAAPSTAEVPPPQDASTTPPRKTAMARPPVEPTPHKPEASQSPKPKAGDPDPGPSDPKKLATWLEERAKNGDAASQYRLGVLYVQGQGVPQDYQRAGRLFRAAAEAGVAEAEYNVAVMYNEGMGVPRDLTQAVFWYQKAAAQGNANAAFNLGVAYANGSGVEQNMEEAARWFRRAGSQGVMNAQFNLALLYERGEGVPVSQVEAYAWYAAAATRGDTGAAQRRDHLASAMSPSEIKEAQARAGMLQQSIQDPGRDAALAKP